MLMAYVDFYSHGCMRFWQGKASNKRIPTNNWLVDLISVSDFSTRTHEFRLLRMAGTRPQCLVYTMYPLTAVDI